MDETDEYKPLSARSRKVDSEPSIEDSEAELLRTIEAENWDHLRATAEMAEVTETETVRHVVPKELLEASIPTRKHRVAVPRPDDPRWVDVVTSVGPDGRVELPEDVQIRLEPGQRLLIRVLVEEE